MKKLRKLQIDGQDFYVDDSNGCRSLRSSREKYLRLKHSQRERLSSNIHRNSVQQKLIGI